jgi:YidC/Oxa1 family membrane protein insertase
MNDDNRNLIAFVIIAVVLVIGYQTFILGPAAKRQQAQRAAAEAAQKVETPLAAVPANLSRPEALAQSLRISIDTPSLYGSISLRGARIDDLFLKLYRESIDKNSPPVELLRPELMKSAYFAELGWVGANLPDVPTPDTVWTVAQGGPLSPGRPVVLTHAGAEGLTFTRKIEVDPVSMFTITDTVTNQGAVPVTLASYGSVQRQGLPEVLAQSGIVHEGAIGVLDGNLKLRKYSAWKKEADKPVDGTSGWLGITEKYWMTALIPPSSEKIAPKFHVTTRNGVDVYETNYTAQPRAVPPGGQISETVHVFAGAKTVPVLTGYKQSLGVPRFEDAVDWGFLWFLTKPIFFLVDYFYSLVKNFGFAILMLTVVIRAIMFPLANKSFEMGTKMKKLQPQLQELQKKFKDDPQAQQKEMMALYAREKVNPLTGCLPIFLQIPVFYSLTKLFTVTIEMRHAPFFGWIRDLSAPDPTTIWNLFGLIPWDVVHSPPILWLIHLPFLGGILHSIFFLGAWPLFYGCTMWLSQAMTPQTGIDPTQQMLFKLMPVIFTFILAQYAVGLLIYWTWSSFITILQQYIIMRRFKVDNPIDDFLARFSPKPAAAE